MVGAKNYFCLCILPSLESVTAPGCRVREAYSCCRKLERAGEAGERVSREWTPAKVEVGEEGCRRHLGRTPVLHTHTPAQLVHNGGHYRTWREGVPSVGHQVPHCLLPSLPPRSLQGPRYKETREEPTHALLMNEHL